MLVGDGPRRPGSIGLTFRDDNDKLL